MFNKYKDVLDFMYAQLPMYQRQGATAFKKDLTNTLALCDVCGNPQNYLKTIHIAGTNGKGSTTHLIAAALQSQGLRIGVYTSPHYIDFRERIKINGELISKRYITQFINTHYTSILDIKPSFFEMTVVLAFQYFKEQKVDYAIIETGLGGRLDSTNVIRPLMSVITNISFDHQNLLGNTLTEIANEKAGIIKENIPVIIGEKQEEVGDVFDKKAKEMEAPIYYGSDIISLECMQVNSLGHWVFDLKMIDGRNINKMHTDISGPFQPMNIVTALAAINRLDSLLGLSLDWKKIVDFMPMMSSKTHFIGRWQVLGDHPLIITDSAHNEAGLTIVFNQLKKLAFDSLHIVIGFVNDKDVTKILELMPQQATYYFCKANIPRGLESIALEKQAKAVGLNGKAYTSIRRALAAAKKTAKKNDLIYVGGSIFVVAEVL